MSNPFARAKALAARFAPTRLGARTPVAVENMQQGAGPLSEAELFAQGQKRSVALLRGYSSLPANKADTVGELFIYEQIGFDCWTGEGVTGKSVADALAEMKGVKTLNVFINSEGGDVFEAKAIYSQLKRFDAQKVMHIDGIAASAATFIAMAGDRIITSPVATWMVHQAWSGAMGRAEDMRAMADLLDIENQTIAETYAARTKGDVAAMLALMAAPPDGTWMNAAKALELRFTDEIAADEDDEEPQASAAAAKSKVAGALALTQSRLKSMSASAVLAAKADMSRRNHPGPAPAPRPASR